MYQSRRILINWGDKTLAVEIIPQPPENFGLSEEKPVKVQEGQTFMGETVYKDLGYSNVPFGRTISDYVTDSEAWYVPGVDSPDL